MKKSIFLLVLFSFASSMCAQINTDPRFSHTPEASIPTYNSLSPSERAIVDRIRTSNYFSETVSTFVPLSKASFWLNKRWTGDAFTDRKNCIIDAYVNPYIHISSDKWFIRNKKYQWMFSMYFNPNFEVRIFNDDPPKGDNSEPVRTPSFRPGAEFFITNSRWFSSARKNNFSLSYKGYHHSNGQDGQEINPVDRLWGKRGYYNTYNGNFSEDFHSEIYLNYYTRNHSNRNFYHLKGGYSVAHGVAYSMKAYNIYGTNGINILGTFIHAPEYHYSIRTPDGNYQRITKDYNIETFRLEMFIGIITNKLNKGPVYDLQPAGMKERLDVHLTAHYRLPGFSEAGLFAETGYYGHDTYNVYFQRSAWFIKAGISFGKFIYYRKTDDLK